MNIQDSKTIDEASIRGVIDLRAIGSPLFTHTLFGFYLGLIVWGGLWLRDPALRNLISFRR